MASRMTSIASSTVSSVVLGLRKHARSHVGRRPARSWSESSTRPVALTLSSECFGLKIAGATWAERPGRKRRAPRELEPFVRQEHLVQTSGKANILFEHLTERVPSIELERHPDPQTAHRTGQLERVVGEIEEERERALTGYRRDRDPLVLEQTMRELDAAEAEAAGGSERPTLQPDEVRRYLENLPAWWADADPDDRRALATTLFERIRVLGVSVAKLEPTQEADHGLAEAFGPDDVEMVGARGVGPTEPS